MESYKNDFLKDEEETFNFDRFGVKFTEMSIVNEEISTVEDFIDELLFVET